MAAGAAKRPIARKRNRKRKRRNVSSSSSSETSSSSSSESENELGREPTTVRLPQKRPDAGAATKSATDVGKRSSGAPVSSQSVDASSSSSSESESETEEMLDSDVDMERVTQSTPSSKGKGTAKETRAQPTRLTSQIEESDEEGDGEPIPALASTHTNKSQRAPSPPPPRNVPVPSILDCDKKEEEALRARFRQFWLGCVADAFADDLNEIRKEPSLTPARLSLLIDSLAAGADVYSSSSSSAPGPDGERVNEMEIVLGDSR